MGILPPQGARKAHHPKTLGKHFAMQASHLRDRHHTGSLVGVIHLQSCLQEARAPVRPPSPQPPAQQFARMERHQLLIAFPQPLRHQVIAALQGDGGRVQRQAIKARAEF